MKRGDPRAALRAFYRLLHTVRNAELTFERTSFDDFRILLVKCYALLNSAILLRSFCNSRESFICLSNALRL